MTEDIIRRAEAALKFDSVKVHGQLVRELIAELKVAYAENDGPYPTQAQLNEDDAKDLQRIVDWIHANDMAQEWMAGEQPVDYIIRSLAALKAARAEIETLTGRTKHIREISLNCLGRDPRGSDRAWLADSILNILNGNVDGQQISHVD